MKAGLVANLFAARALKRLGLIDCPMTLMFSPDEELGSPSASRTLAQVLPGARAAINSEPGGPGGLVTVSRKGSGHMFLKVQGKASHAGRCYADGASAILEIAHKTLAIDTFLDLERGLTVNTGLISGGTSANWSSGCRPGGGASSPGRGTSSCAPPARPLSGSLFGTPWPPPGENRVKAAALLDISRTVLYEKMEQYQLK